MCAFARKLYTYGAAEVLSLFSRRAEKPTSSDDSSSWSWLVDRPDLLLHGTVLNGDGERKQADKK